MIDLLEHHKLNDANKIDVLDHGFVRLVDVMPRVAQDEDNPTGDYAIVQSARVSYGKGTKQVNQDRGLIRYLMRHKHTSPYEHVSLKFHCKIPIFVARQWVRHRTAKINEYSGRYSVMSDDFYLPDASRINIQSQDNKQGTSIESGYDEKTRIQLQEFFNDEQETAREMYDYYLQQDMARELARINLPVSNYTEWYWKIDLHNLFHFLKLRLDEHAQYEIRVYAQAIYDFIKPIFPLACEAFEDYILNGHNISSTEVNVLKRAMEMENMDSRVLRVYIERAQELSKRERDELISKLGL